MKQTLLYVTWFAQNAVCVLLWHLEMTQISVQVYGKPCEA